jgi:SNF2 family DNA or RNA helicase
MFVSQIATGSMGIDLTAARITVMYSFDHKWVDYAQAIERTYGPKQTRPVVVHHLLATNTLNRGILNVLKARGDLSHAVIHDPRKLLGFDPLDN